MHAQMCLVDQPIRLETMDYVDELGKLFGESSLDGRGSNREVFHTCWREQAPLSPRGTNSTPVYTSEQLHA